ncbi:hypothetical protein HPB48_017332 [Haemaphysalis longicornis]|uniref:YqaJ viral recombinase domain-containing protein n=1 Tax=Haemaphysalis longicornis TaxID=44386 RepID=A0A9J6GPY7_HAELO|nr:hypothetical protein HPB48_017332 [Haemaphysalis longicornis]
MAGRGKVCIHVGALLYKVDMAVSKQLTGKTSTDLLSAWNHGTKRNVEPAALVDINFRRKQRTVDDEVITKKVQAVPNILGNDGDIKRFFEDSSFSEIATVPGTLLQATLGAPVRQPEQPHVAEVALHSSHQDVQSLPQSFTPCNDFYMQNIVLSREGATTLEVSTRDQNNYLWHVSRRIRITASNTKKIPKRATTPAIKALQALTNPNFHGNAGTRHGLKREEVARSQFQAENGLVVEKRGTHVYEEHPWLSATPDDVVEGYSAIIEIKCPFVEDCNDLVHSGKYDVTKKGDAYVLTENGPNGYYGQVQLTMFCTKTAMCLFYVWSLKQAICLDIPYNAAYIDSLLPLFRWFYFCNMLPDLHEIEIQGKLDLAEYQEIAKMQTADASDMYFAVCCVYDI